MALHKLKLYFIAHKASIIFFTMALGMFTTLFVGMYLLVATQAQGAEIRKNQEQNQQILKGLSCILLILPENRTQQKIENCIEINAEQPSNYDFYFKALEKSSSFKDTNPDFISLLRKELKIKNGTDGVNGVDGKNAVSTTTKIKEQVPLKGIKGDTGAAGREVELQYNSLKQRLEWRYTGEDIWTVLVNACELTNTCQ